MQSGYVVQQHHQPDRKLPDTPGEIHVIDGALFFYTDKGDVDYIFAAGIWESVAWVEGDES